MSVSRMYLAASGILLIGYAIFDKGFAYFGYAPLYVGEIFLAFSFLILLMGGYSTRVLGSPIVWPIIVFMVWGAVRTFPYLETYGLYAMRDGVLWLYAIFAIFIGSALLRARALGSVLKWYNAWIPWFLILAPLFFIVSQKASHLIPTYPWSGRPIVSMKPGDMGVHLAGIAAFLGLGLHRQFIKPGQIFSQFKEFGLWLMWGMGVIAAGSRNRGGFLAVLVACAVILAFKPGSRLNRVILPIIVIVLLAFAFDLRIPIGGKRDISVQQIVDNVESVLFKSNKSHLSGTAKWRLIWWTQIRDETLFGDYFWDGRGFGENIAEAHGFGDHTGNRSPHNGHLTILARSGVPGMLMWLIIVVVVGYSLIQGYFRMRSIGQDTLANLNLWALAYWLAFLVNASFDVFLEGPQGGIWYWCVVGFAIALTEEQRQLYSQTIAKQKISPRVSMGRLR